MRACGVPSPMVVLAFEGMEEAMWMPNWLEAVSSWSCRGGGGGRSCRCSSVTLLGSEASKLAVMTVWE